jgi:hypothetical protein
VKNLIPTLLFASGIALAVFGVSCVAKPHKMADYCRGRHLRNSRFTQRWPFASMVMEPWMPTYLRFAGLFVLAFAMLLLYPRILSHLKVVPLPKRALTFQT